VLPGPVAAPRDHIVGTRIHERPLAPSGDPRPRCYPARVNVRFALLTILSTIPLTGCPSTWNCDPDDEQLDVDEEVMAAVLDELVQTYGVSNRTQLECEDVCRQVYSDTRGWQTGSIDSCELTLPENPDDGTPGHVTCTGTGYEYICEGRRPLGHVERGDEDCSDPLGRTLAAMAYLEEASVLAFEQLANQLSDFAAPDELIERCREAARDERAHARWLTVLAQRHGASVPIVTQTPATSELLDVALHNAVEGCVHETFAALLATVRAQRATSPVLRRVFARIAVDETAHGQLAWDLHAWLQTRLDADGAASVAAAQRLALARLPKRALELAKLPEELGSLADAESLALALCERLAA
jgi:hypothetical protein